MVYWIYVIPFVLITAAIVAVVLFSEKNLKRSLRTRCPHCDEDTFSFDKNLCVNCGVTRSGEQLSDEELKKIKEQPRIDFEKRKKANRIALLVFIALGIVALIFFIYKITSH